jgi:glycosyltransferase involved in cell wall biosynthesis
MPSTLSVVLPNYNHAKFIGRALRALLDQERTPDEIIIIDDGSTDESLGVIERFAATAPSISVLTNPSNQGVIPALQRGLQSARGTHIYFAAADDFVLPGFFKLALRRLQADPEVGFFCGEAVLVDGRNDRPFAVRPPVRPIMRSGRVGAAQAENLLRSIDNWILTISTVFRRDCILWAGGFDERLGSFADGFLARKIALRYGFFFEPKVVATWVIYPGSVSRATALDPQRAQHSLDLVPALIAADPAFPPWYGDAFRDRWRFATCRLALQADPVNRELLLTMGARSAAERAELERTVAWPRRKLARLVILARLWYRFRPVTLTTLLRTMLAMRAVRQIVGFRLRQFRSRTARAMSGHD